MFVLICGASGLVGRALGKYLSDLGISWVGTSSKRQGHVKWSGEVSILEELQDKFKFTHVVNCIASRFIEDTEKDWKNTYHVNVNIAQVIAEWADSHSIPLLHISTDYVFDGKNPPYNSNSTPNPLQNYGITKLIAEYRVLASNTYKKHTILRVPVLYTLSPEGLADSSVSVIARKVIDTTKKWYEDNYYVRRPLLAEDMCKVMFLILKDSKDNKDNNHNKDCIVHLGDVNNRFTKWQISKEIADVLNCPHTITNVDEPPQDGVPRPGDTRLLSLDHNITFTPFKEAIRKIFSSFYYDRTLKDCFIMIDLDGTLIDTDGLHIKSYEKAIQSVNIIPPTKEEALVLIDTNGYKNWLNTNAAENKDKITSLKKDILIKHKPNLMPGAKELLEYINKNNINAVVVTNSSSEIINYWKERQPLLNCINQCISREDYEKAKPSSDCYNKAIEKFYRNETYILGIENTTAGINSLPHKCIKILFTEYNSRAYTLTSKDIYKTSNLTSIFNT